MCIIKTQQYGCGCFKDSSAPIELCRFAKLVFPPAVCPTFNAVSQNCIPYSPSAPHTPSVSYTPSQRYYPPSSHQSHGPSTPYGPEDIDRGRGYTNYENGNGNIGRVLEGCVQRSLWMCIDCCPVKKYTKGEETELWRNWCGVSLGSSTLSNGSLEGLAGAGLDTASSRYRRVFRNTPPSPRQEVNATPPAYSPDITQPSTPIRERENSGSESSRTDLSQAATFHQQFWSQQNTSGSMNERGIWSGNGRSGRGSGRSGSSSKSARLLGISEEAINTLNASKAETWPKPSKKLSRLTRVLERVSSRVSRSERAPGFS